MATFVILLRILVTASFCLSFTAVNAARDRNGKLSSSNAAVNTATLPRLASLLTIAVVN